WIHRSTGLAGIRVTTTATTGGAQLTRGNVTRASSADPSIQGTRARASTAPLSTIGMGTPGTRAARSWKAAGEDGGVWAELATALSSRLEALPVSRMCFSAERWYSVS